MLNIYHFCPTMMLVRWFRLNSSSAASNVLDILTQSVTDSYLHFQAHDSNKEIVVVKKHQFYCVLIFCSKMYTKHCRLWPLAGCAWIWVFTSAESTKNWDRYGSYWMCDGTNKKQWVTNQRCRIIGARLRKFLWLIYGSHHTKNMYMYGLIRSPIFIKSYRPYEIAYHCFICVHHQFPNWTSWLVANNLP